MAQKMVYAKENLFESIELSLVFGVYSTTQLDLTSTNRFYENRCQVFSNSIVYFRRNLWAFLKMAIFCRRMESTYPQNDMTLKSCSRYIFSISLIKISIFIDFIEISYFFEKYLFFSYFYSNKITSTPQGEVGIWIRTLQFDPKLSL